MDSFEVVLPRRAAPQPVPFLDPFGDCGACVVAGVAGLSVPEVYGEFRGGEPGTIGLRDMQALLRKGMMSGRFEGATEEWPLMWSGVQPEWQSWGVQARHQAGPWHTYLRVGLEAGYYGLALVNMRGEGPHSYGTDHWVVLCGARARWDTDGDTRRRRAEVLVSCSARTTPAEEWVVVQDFLKERGGFIFLLLRPRREG